MPMAVSIIGAGNCGCAFAADLISRGAHVLLYAHASHRRHVDEMERNGCLEASGRVEGRFWPTVTSNMDDIISFSKFIIVTVPAYGHQTIVEQLAKFDLSQHVIICVTGNFFALAARKTINPLGIIETSTSPYASRMQDGKVLIMGIKKTMPIAAMPVDIGQAFRRELSDLFPMPLEWRKNVLEIGLSCITGVIHPTPALMNAGWIESTRGNFYFYREGMSPAVAEVIGAIDRDRMAISRAFSFESPSVLAIMNRYYGQTYSSFTEFAQKSTEHNATKMAPAHMKERFIVQDVPFVLVPWFELGLKVGIYSAVIRSLIDLASTVNGVKYLETGRTMRKLGLDATSRSQILDIVNATNGALANRGVRPSGQSAVKAAELDRHGHH